MNNLFCPKERWSANSPDLNPLDYYYWNSVVTRMNRTEIPTGKSDLIEAIKKTAKAVPLEETKNAILAFPRLVRKVEANEGIYLA